MIGVLMTILLTFGVFMAGYCLALVHVVGDIKAFEDDDK